MKIFDAFIFGGYGVELDLLEIRLNELNDYVERFIIIEQPHTHAGENKPLYFQENKEKFSKFLHKITYQVITVPPERRPIDNEVIQRNAIKDAIIYSTRAEGMDWVMISDLDEIPSKESLEELRGCDDMSFGIPLHYHAFYLNLRAASPSVGVRCVRASTLLNMTPQQIRLHPFNGLRAKNCGYHLTYQCAGDIKIIQQKLKAFSHSDDFDPRLGKKTRDTSEQDIATDLERLRTKLEHPMCPNWRFVTLAKGELPDYILENPEKFRDWLL